MKTLLPILNEKSASERFLGAVDIGADLLGLSVDTIVDLDQLRTLPEHSFGREWANFLDREQLTPLTTGPRRKQLHDGVHVLTGYGTDALGEAQVQAFVFGTNLELANLLLMVGLLRRSGWAWPAAWRAFLRGRRSRFDVDRFAAEAFWELPLGKVQEILGITAEY